MDLDLVRALTAEFLSLDRRVGIWLALLCGMTFGVVVFSVVYPIQFVGLDFQSFWCGGAVLLAHANPYLNQPLHACEAAHSPVFFSAYPNATIPVPLPPYAIALLAPLSLIPFPLARGLWWIVLAAAAYAVGTGIAKITGMSPVTATAASYLAVLGPAIFPGALAPIPVAVTVFAALALKQKKWNRAAILLGLAMIEPHMVLPACAAAFLFVPQMRLRLIVLGLFTALVMIAVVGPHVVASYFAVILPTHALAEVNNLAQYSLTAVLYHLGFAPGLAVRIGSVQYAVLITASVFVAGRLQRKTGDLSWLVLAPSAFAVIGGPFIHLDQVAMVIPMACAIVRSRPTKLASVILVMLAIPGEILINWLPFTLPAALICGWLVAQTKARWAVAIASSIAVVVVACSLVALLIFGNHLMAASGTPYPAVPTIRVAAPGPDASASVPWAQFTSSAVFRPWIWWPEKLLTLVPVLVLLGLTLREALGKSRAAGSAGCTSSPNSALDTYSSARAASPGTY